MCVVNLGQPSCPAVAQTVYQVLLNANSNARYVTKIVLEMSGTALW